ncbi:MAG: hypothetical protein KDC91_05015, partial [Flavobacteriaceae bacterium]|nr:hypothetical protein [Flavobacteriaceae bacterium]
EKLKNHPRKNAVLKEKLQDVLETDFHHYSNFVMKVDVDSKIINEYLSPFLVDNQREMGAYVIRYYFGNKDNVDFPKKGEGWSAFKQRIKNGGTTPTIVKNIQREYTSLTRSVGQEKIAILMSWESLEDAEKKKAYCSPLTIYTRNNSTNGQDVPVQGYYKAKLYQTPNNSNVQIEGSLELPGSLYDHRFTDRELYHLGIICSHSMYPTQSWLDMNPEKQCYTVTYVATKEGDGIKFQYTDYRNNKVIVSVSYKRGNSYGTPVFVNLDINP